MAKSKLIPIKNGWAARGEAWRLMRPAEKKRYESLKKRSEGTRRLRRVRYTTRGSGRLKHSYEQGY